MTRPNAKCSSYLGDRVRLEVLDWGGSVRPVVLLGGVGKVRTYLRRLRRKISWSRSRLLHHATRIRDVQSSSPSGSSFCKLQRVLTFISRSSSGISLGNRNSVRILTCPVRPKPCAIFGFSSRKRTRFAQSSAFSTKAVFIPSGKLHWNPARKTGNHRLCLPERNIIWTGMSRLNNSAASCRGVYLTNPQPLQTFAERADLVDHLVSTPRAIVFQVDGFRRAVPS